MIHFKYSVAAVVVALVLLLLCVIYSQKRQIDRYAKTDLSFFTDEKPATQPPPPITRVVDSAYIQKASEPQAQPSTAQVLPNRVQLPKTDMMFLQKYIPKKGEPETVSALEQTSNPPMHDTVSREFMQNQISTQIAARQQLQQR